MGKKLLLILALFCICLLTCRHDNKKNNNNNTKKEMASGNNKLKRKHKKKPKDIMTKKKQHDDKTKKQDNIAITKKDENGIDDDDDEQDNDGIASIAVADKVQQGTTPKEQQVTTPQEQQGTTPKGQQVTTPKGQQGTTQQDTLNQSKVHKSETVQLKFANDQPTTYYFKEYLIKDIIPSLHYIKASISLLSRNITYPIIKDADLPHIRILASKQELDSMHIKDLHSLGNSPFLTNSIKNKSDILKVMLFSHSNNKENIILPLNQQYVKDLEIIHQATRSGGSLNSKHMIDLRLGHDDIYTKLTFSQFNSTNIAGSIKISILTDQVHHSSIHELKLDGSILTLLKKITTIENLKKLLTD
ncbi:hypothetical protein DB313_04575 (plasmid) [Borrelia turcica IST7]|uniref:Uncharacterized protein n=1 Tax=Borrelia turcica IST7 TaxID=1104446 RepID=A0A386PMG8_9SPIR|nr:hypothetical protein [Borrelia turcica]AYE36776.1 hypothetical protein DB313_04575 [Borrelia turcica IST7]